MEEGSRQQTHTGQVLKIDLAAFSFCLPINPLFTEISEHTGNESACSFHHLEEFLSVYVSVLDSLAEALGEKYSDPSKSLVV